jgi:two-component system chemotaxis response regulator CheB
LKKIRVLIVEDSAVVREYLRHIISTDDRFEVVGMVPSGEEALRVLPGLAPDVITMDIRLPGIDGLETTRRIMVERPTPIVVVAASVQSEDLRIAANALRAGALSVVEKPVGLTHAQYESVANHLRTQLAIMSEVTVVRQRWVRPQDSPAAPPPSSLLARRTTPLRIAGIVASTGGPPALVQLLNALPADFPIPILVVQHITASFLEGFAAWLDSVCPQKVQVARHGEQPTKGTVYLAPGDQHLGYAGGVLRLDSGPPVSAQRPSGTVLFESLADGAGVAALGVLLTGMGDDGARGLLAMRRAGSYTIAEDQSTAVVYGMPAAAVALGAVQESLPLPGIAPRLLALLGRRQEVR